MKCTRNNEHQQDGIWFKSKGTYFYFAFGSKGGPFRTLAFASRRAMSAPAPGWPSTTVQQQQQQQHPRHVPPLAPLNGDGALSFKSFTLKRAAPVLVAAAPLSAPAAYPSSTPNNGIVNRIESVVENTITNCLSSCSFSSSSLSSSSSLLSSSSSSSSSS